MLLKVRLSTGEVIGTTGHRITLSSEGSLYFAGQARLDNRGDLLGRLGLPGRLSDAELIVHAYLNLGDNHPAHLLGDFAYALFDERQRRLILVRDHLGVAPLYYHLTDDLCIASDSLDEMLAQAEIPRDLDEGVVAEWCLNGHVYNQTDTFYSAIRKLPRATQLSLASGAPRVRAYWSDDDIRPLRYPDDQSYIDHLHDLLRTVILDRLGATGVQAAHSSGGLDSTPIAILAGRACRAQGRNFHTYNWCRPEAGDDRESHEWTDARCVAQAEGFIHREIGVTSESLTRSLLHHDLARDGTTMFEYEARLLKLAQGDGVERIFSGFGGDEILTTRSRDQHTGAIRAGRFLYALRRLAMEADPGQRWWLPRLGLNYGRLLRRAWLLTPPERQEWHQRQALGLAARLALLRPEFAAFAASRYQPNRYFLADGIAEKQRIMLHQGYHQERMESWAILGSRHRVRYLYPYLDKRIVEFALAVPSALHFRQGRPRHLYTQALGDALPQLLRVKPKLPESERVRQLVHEYHAALGTLEVAERVTAASSGYVDTAKLLKELKRLARLDASDWPMNLLFVVAATGAIRALNLDAAPTPAPIRAKTPRNWEA